MLPGIVSSALCEPTRFLMGLDREAPALSSTVTLGLMLERLLIATFCGRKINFTNSKDFGWWMSRPTATRVPFDLPECEEPFYRTQNENEKKRKKRKHKEKRNALKTTEKMNNEKNSKNEQNEKHEKMKKQRKKRKEKRKKLKK